MERQKLKGTNLYVRNFGSGRSRIMIIEPETFDDYDPIRVRGCSVVLFNLSVMSELGRFYARSKSRYSRNEVFPGGISSTADVAIKNTVLKRPLTPPSSN